MKEFQKRRCQNFSMNHFINGVDSSCSEIVEKYEELSERTMHESLKYLERLSRDYVLKKKLEVNSKEKGMHLLHDINLLEKKQLGQIEVDGPRKNGVNENQNRPYSFSSAQKKPTHSNSKSSQKIGNSKLKAKLDRISEKMEAFSIADYPSSEEESDLRNQNQNKLNIQDNISSKSLNQLIRQSIKKSKLDAQKHPLPSILDQSQSEYEMTDYSSNQSSNDNTHEEIFKYDFEDKPLFGGLFNQNKASSELSEAGSNALTFKTKSSNAIVFRPSLLLHSPQKQKNSRKRAYMNNKRIPKWAENQEDIARLVEEQARDQRFDTLKIYGRCVVEHLDTNLIFNSKEEIIRNSSAKWNKINAK